MARQGGIDPLTIIGEILGEPAAAMRNPANAEYQCPFINSECVKRSHRISGPYPVCSIWRNRPTRHLMCTCPKRFYQADLRGDVIKHCWIGEPPKNPRIAYEVTMRGFGTVDFVLADVDEDTQHVRQFVSVELQAVDFSGSVEPAYNAVLNSTMLSSRPTHGVNWANVRKRYITQLIAKGFFHHHWGTRMVAVLQTPLYEYFRSYINFDELAVTDSNIVFMLYRFVPDPERNNGAQKMELERVTGTSHSSVMTATLYRQAPEREAFCQKILSNLS